MPHVSIGKAGPEDVPLLVTLIGELAEYERLAHEAVATEADLHEAMFGADRVIEVLIARVDGEPAGYALFFHNFSTFTGRRGIYLEDLFVRPASRGLGIGRMLLERLAAMAVERGCKRLEWSVLDWNDLAIGFYKSIGAVPMDGWTVYRMSGESLKKLGSGDRSPVVERRS